MRIAIFIIFILIGLSAQNQNLRRINLDISAEFPPGEVVDAKTVELNGKDVRGNLFYPGVYQLKIAEPGFATINKSLVISDEEFSFVIREVLRVKPRKIEIKITYDIEPPDYLENYKVVLTLLNEASVVKYVKSNDIIKPGIYLLRITKPAYQTVEIKQYVWPDNNPYMIEQKLYAKRVPINALITHDVKPSDNLESYFVSIVSKKTRALLMAPEKIRPGKYDLKISQPGYKTVQKVLDIKPSEKLFLVKEKLIAKKRPISFEFIVTNGGCLQDACKVIDLKTQQKIGFRDLFKPGQEMHLRFKFDSYKDLEVKIILPPGEGPYSHFNKGIALVHLYPICFTVRRCIEIMDGFEYECSFTIDGQIPEDIHIKKERGFRCFYYTLMVLSKAKNFRAYIGYKYTQVDLKNFHQGMMIEQPNNISVAKLIEHLDRIAKNESYNTSLNVIKKLLKNSPSRKILKQLTNRNQLITYLKTWKLNTTERSQLQLLIKDIIKN
ncbi:hypothetical protein [Candidatus Uabimicrobium sp. HlEnr_7]|uniref:hypothetical protein n=1 Tax=Candidatus Uabimicrobium helgolandensis TaxID=3095367 RepID=UPI003558F95F